MKGGSGWLESSTPPALRRGEVLCCAQSLRGHSELQLLLLRNPVTEDRRDKCLEGRKGCRAHASLNTQNHLSARAVSAVEIF